MEASDGLRLLICRIRPRGVAKAAEPWDAWWPDLGPSRALLDDFHGKRRAAIPWDEYVPRYLDEMLGAAQLWRIRDLARRVAGGATVTLLCSSACTDSGALPPEPARQPGHGGGGASMKYLAFLAARSCLSLQPRDFEVDMLPP